MKINKIISFTLFVSILINLFTFCACAEESEIDVYEYSTLIQKLTNAYLPDSFASMEDITEVPLNRLIVKTNTNEPLKNDYGAADKIEGYNCLHILQYETENQAQNAFENLSYDNIEYVEYDCWLTINDTFSYCYCEDNPSENLACQCSSDPEEHGYCACVDTTALPNHKSWNSAAAQVDKAFELIKESGIDCEPVMVAVLDSGIYANHEFFLKENSDGITESVIKVDNKYSYVLDQTSYPSNEDDYYHGTHVAGIIHDNSMDNVEIYSYRMMGTKRKSLSSAELSGAIDAAVAKGADVINMSLRRTDFFKDDDMKTLKESIEKAVSKNVVLVSAAGNESNDANVYIPARYDEVITVSATTREDAPDTNYSSYGTCVDIAAPGTDIYSSTPRIPGRNDDKQIPEAESLYMRISGTSMATPLVSAAAAMIKSIDPDITPAEVKRLIKETAYIPDDWEENCGENNYGTGIVNFYNIAKAILDPEYSATPTISVNSDNKFEITAPDGVDAKIFYTLDGTIPTLENHLTYTAPLNLRAKNATSVKAACYENGKIISEPAVYDLITNNEKTVFCKWSSTLTTDADTSNAKWRSYNPNIASVDSEGNIKGVSKGDTLITCSLPTGERIIWKVNVKYSPLQAFFVMFFFGFLWI